MVITPTISKILRRFERYFLSLNNFSLDGKSYDLIFVNSSSASIDERYTWIISYSKLNSLDTKKIIVQILTDLRAKLTVREYLSIESIQIVNSELPFVKNINFMFPFNQNSIELKDIIVGGIQIDQGLILKSALLQNLKRFKEITVYLDDGIRRIMPISMDSDYNIKYFTTKGLNGLQDISRLKDSKSYLKQREKELIEGRQISFISFDRIKNIVA